MLYLFVSIRKIMMKNCIITSPSM